MGGDDGADSDLTDGDFSGDAEASATLALLDKLQSMMLAARVRIILGRTCYNDLITELEATDSQGLKN